VSALPDSDRPDLDLDAIRQRLLDRRAELEALGRAGAEVRGPVELDPQVQGRLSRMDALQVQAMGQEQERRRGIELQRIAAALGRLAEGEYGWCVNCGEAIARKRLENDPSVPTCIDCAGG
jgi:DnaK suppressor protein